MTSRMPVRPVAAVLLSVALLGGTAACGGDDASSEKTTLTVFAAASLTEPFTAIGKEFESAHPGTTVEFSFGASSDLATQVQQGAPADVLATASTSTMDLVDEDVTDRQDFASNSLEIAVPADNPAKISGLDDLTDENVSVAVCEEQVPCGAVAAQVFENAGITVTPVTEENDVKAVLTKVGLGEVDAGLVYVSDVATAGDDVTGVPIPDDVNAVTTYPIAVVTASDDADLAGEFREMVLSDVGRKALTDAGLATP